jgi:capsid portal protein
MPTAQDPRIPTRGDQSPEAATAGADEAGALSITEITYASPAASDPDGPIMGTIGDRVFSARSSYPGGAELVIQPTEEPQDAYRVFKLSPILSSLIDALNVNVYSAGYTLAPVLATEDPEARESVRQALAYLAAWAQRDFEHATTISDDAVNTELDRIRTRIGNEKQFLQAWLQRACPGSTFLTLCQLTGQDLEVQGDAYWEVLRDESGAPAKLIWAPAWSIRAKPIQDEMIGVDVPVKLSSYTWGMERQARRYRSYVQLDLNNSVIARYKEYGDPRCLSRGTGKYYLTLQDMLANPDEWYEDANHTKYPPLPATEILHFALANPLSTAYGRPGYSGVFPVLNGTRDLSEENSTLIVDRKVPQMFVLIAGGVGVAPKEIERLEESIRQNAAKGNRSIYFIQARSAKTDTGTLSPTPTIEIVKTKSEQYQDALGLEYHKHAERQVEHAYRFPAAALGRHEELTDTAIQAGYRFAEAQVYDPRRDSFDDRINSTLLPDLGIQLTKYKTRARTPKEPHELAQIIQVLMEAGVLTPDEGRVLAGDIFGRQFHDLEGIWSKLPTKLLLAMLQTKNQLVAAALLGSESESDVIARLQAALVAQLPGGSGDSAGAITDGGASLPDVQGEEPSEQGNGSAVDS